MFIEKKEIQGHYSLREEFLKDLKIRIQAETIRKGDETILYCELIQNIAPIGTKCPCAYNWDGDICHNKCGFIKNVIAL